MLCSRRAAPCSLPPSFTLTLPPDVWRSSWPRSSAAPTTTRWPPASEPHPVTRLMLLRPKYSSSSRSFIPPAASRPLIRVCVCAAAGGQRSVSVLVSGPSVRLSVLLPQSRPAAGDVPTRRLDQPSSRAEGQRSHTHTCCATECTPPLAVLIRASFDLRSGLRGSAGAS